MYQNGHPSRRPSAQYNPLPQQLRRQSTQYNQQWTRPDYRSAQKQNSTHFEPVTYSGGNNGLVNYPANSNGFQQPRSPTSYASYDYGSNVSGGWSDPQPNRQSYSTPSPFCNTASTTAPNPYPAQQPARRFSTTEGMSNAEMVAAAIKARAAISGGAPQVMSVSHARFAVRRKGDKNSGESSGLYSVQTFSVDDMRFMEFGPLRVFNEDRMGPGAGYGSNLHRDFEILHYVVSGDSLSYRDSIGSNEVLPEHGVLLVSAGTGVMHSVTNVAKPDAAPTPTPHASLSQLGTPPPPSLSHGRSHSTSSLTSASSASDSNFSSPGTAGRASPESVTSSAGHILQVWIKPWSPSLKPAASIKPFKTKEKRNKLLPMVVPNSEEQPTQLFHGIPLSRILRVHQDLYMFACVLDLDESARVTKSPESLPKVVHRPLGTDRKICIHVLDITLDSDTEFDDGNAAAVVVNDAVVLGPGDTVFVDRASIGDRIELKRGNFGWGRVEFVLFDMAANEQHWAKA
ncbi:hypothetical protein BJ742DRAFT_117538 [Cladochytrium replicatum]|nr:hypothetical protein BJ742DRAFT_117538 [Cladochytrium replicatum]